MYLMKSWQIISQALEKERYLGTARTEDPKQDEPKQTHTKNSIIKMTIS